jgi:hypothetical protein
MTPKQHVGPARRSGRNDRTEQVIFLQPNFFRLFNQRLFQLIRLIRTRPFLLFALSCPLRQQFTYFHGRCEQTEKAREVDIFRQIVEEYFGGAAECSVFGKTSLREPPSTL